MKVSLFGVEIEIKKKEEPLYKKGAEAKKKQSWEKIEKALEEIEKKQKSFSEYQIQKLSGVSINTVKKYREKIKEWREKRVSNLLS